MYKISGCFKKYRGKIHNIIVAIIPIIKYNILIIMEILIMEYLTTTELSKLWNISARRIGVLCTETSGCQIQEK